MESQASAHFVMELDYFRTGRITGNIYGWRWSHPSAPDAESRERKTYKFTYDGFGRLSSAVSLPGNFNERDISYDRNGNIMALRRMQETDVLNDLTYRYTGNRLTGISDEGEDYTYQYDRNGNMTYDGRKDLHFAYNYLNLLSSVKQKRSLIGNMAPLDSLVMFDKGGIVIEGPIRDTTGRVTRLSESFDIADYKWLADGTKLQVADSTGRGYAYLGSLVYEKEGPSLTLESIGFNGGRIVASEGAYGADYAVHYQVTDHLGSVRVILTDNNNVIARNDYYAFGKKHQNPNLQAAASSINRWLYNGKEWQTTADIGFLDHGARMYDQEMGRWFGMDFLSEKYYSISPFVYCANNSINAIDPNGMHYYMLTADGQIVLALQSYDSFKNGIMIR